MRFQLKQSGTNSECREALNAAIAALPLPETQENKVVRMAAHKVVADYLDPQHDEWQRSVQSTRAFNIQARGNGATQANEPAEPSASFAIDITITHGV